MEVGYADLPRQQRINLAVGTFATLLGNVYLLRHLLAVTTTDLELAVGACKEYISVEEFSPRTSGRSEKLCYNIGTLYHRGRGAEKFKHACSKVV